jgi:hypothetical protein
MYVPEMKTEIIEIMGLNFTVLEWIKFHETGIGYIGFVKRKRFYSIAFKIVLKK